MRKQARRQQVNPGVSGLGDRSGRTENGDAETTDVDRRELVPKDDGRNKDDGDLLEDASDGAKKREISVGSKGVGLQ